MRIADKPELNKSKLICPWHAWTYDLEGKLVSTPAIGGEGVNSCPGFDGRELGLLPIRCDTWMGFIFVNIDGTAEPLSTFLSPVRKRLSHCDLSLLNSDGAIDDVKINANWKLMVEGGVENYHLPWVHPKSGGHRGITREDSDPAGSYVGISTRWFRQKPKDDEIKLPLFPQLGNRDNEAYYNWEDIYLFVSPGTTIIEVMPDHVVTVMMMPISVEQTLLRRAFYFIGEQSLFDKYENIRKRLKDFWYAFGEQDRAILEVVQKQQKIRSEISLPTRFSPHWETAVHRFQQFIVSSIKSPVAREQNSADN